MLIASLVAARYSWDIVLGDMILRIQALHLVRPHAIAAIALAGLIAGCSADSALLDNSASLGEPSTAATRPSAANVSPIVRSLAYRPAMGPPDDVGAQLTKQLNTAALAHGIALVVDPAVPMDLTLRAYVSAVPKGSNVSLMHLWDLVDGRGNRLHRVSGEEALSGAGSGQPWTAATSDVLQAIATRAMDEIADWAKRNPSAAPTAGAAAPPPTGAGAGSLAVR